ncbi:hypothetical protein [Acanthopleuribacter pedis]|uniref:Uncharacterized protein n=1 Tax=Acanthopleuribacter pedis TaxID=442870 RepID=A0A8J7U5N8_9BACT|nr:hypothetical protein [Acanthopleuribacter pedis]MBO1322758.1 hypothetical protein [Acanthopleuribacter pedis]
MNDPVFVISPQARLAEVTRELDQLQGEVSAWLSTWANRDRAGLFQSQRQVLARLFASAHDQLRTRLAPEQWPDTPDERRLHGLRTARDQVWLRRLLGYYRDKYAQRETAAELLSAADEVVWSCYAPALIEAEDLALPLDHRPPPLAYLHHEVSPAAVLPHMVPGAVRTHDPKLSAFIQTLPIPLLILPDLNQRAPWWLVLIGHEVGHHLHYALAPKGALIPAFENAVRTAVRDLGLPDVYLWGDWSMELFADVVSVHLMGPEAVSAVACFELADPRALDQHKARYPAPLLRVALLGACWKHFSGDDRPLLGSPWSDLLAGLANASPTYAAVDQIASALCGDLPGLGVSISELCGRNPADFLPGGRVDDRAAWLLGDGAPSQWQALDDAALFAAAGFRAWRELQNEPAARLKHLAERILQTLNRCGPPGVRDDRPIPALDVPDALAFFADQVPS